MKEGKTDQENFPVKTLAWDRAFDIKFKKGKRSLPSQSVD